MQAIKNRLDLKIQISAYGFKREITRFSENQKIELKN